MVLATWGVAIKLSVSNLRSIAPFAMVCLALSVSITTIEQARFALSYAMNAIQRMDCSEKTKSVSSRSLLPMSS